MPITWGSPTSKTAIPRRQRPNWNGRSRYSQISKMPPTRREFSSRSRNASTGGIPLSRADPRISAIVLERQLAVMLPQEVQEALVLTGLHVKEPGNDLVIATRLF